MTLATQYLGFDLPHPFIPGASPLADNLDSARRMEDAGAPMIILRSLFEEEIVGEQMETYYATEALADSFGEAASFLAVPAEAMFGTEQYLDHIRRVRDAVAVPVVASLNGHTRGGWLQYAKEIEQAGASALELNLYEIATDIDRTASEVEREAIDIIREVRQSISLPLAVKVSPFYTSIANVAGEIDSAGADAIVLFNRFYQPDIDIEELHPVPALRLSDSSELLLRLRWLAILYKQLDADLVITGGVHSVTDAVKALMCGAQVVQMVSSLLQRGPEHLRHIVDGVAAWMNEKGYESIDEMRGSMSLLSCPDPAAFERANYLRILHSWRP